jgi:hypothetical protein
MKEYIHENKIVFILDEDGDSFETFQESLKFIENYIIPNKIKYKYGYWGESNGYFVKDGITVYLEYSNWIGTVIKVNENLPKHELEKVRNWAEKIYNNINNSNTR